VLQVTAVSEVDILGERQNLSLDFGASCREVRAMLTDRSREENLIAREFTLDSPMVQVSPELVDFARGSFAEDHAFLGCVRDLTERIYREFTYDPHHTDVATPLVDVIRHRRGVCQDFAHLAIGCLRAMGFAARYVSGYLETLPPPGQPKLEGSDASHAWFSVYSPTEGWCDFDPTNNLLASQQHITTAWGRDYSDVTPVKGTILGGGASHGLEVEVDVHRLEGAP
jgi:transglutaminase-like putative cysteine protease